MNNDDAIYSYVEKRMITSESRRISFDPNRHKREDTFTVGDLLKRILLYGVIILILSSFIFYPNTVKSSENTQNFINDISALMHDTNDIMNTIVTEFNNNNFSTSYKEELRSKLLILENIDLNKYGDSKYSSLRLLGNQVLNGTIDSINIILNCYSADSYTSGMLNSNLKSIRSNVDLYIDTLFNFFDDNNIIYTVNSNGSYTYRIP